MPYPFLPVHSLKLNRNAAPAPFRKPHLDCYVSAWLLICISILTTGSALAQTETLTDDNSTVTIDLTGSGAGMNSWTVDGQNQLSDQWFYYRIGNTGTAGSIGNLTLTSVSQPAPGMLTSTYTGSQFSLQVVYSLVGGGSGSGTADLSEQIKIQNLTSSPLAFNFFQYANFQFDGPGGQNNQILQLGTDCGKLFNEALITSGNTSLPGYVDVGVASGANNAEAGLASTSLNNITGVNGYNLNNTTSAGPGNTAFAFQWTNGIAPHGSMIISEDLNISGAVDVSNVPEPAALSLVALGLAAYAMRGRISARCR